MILTTQDREEGRMSVTQLENQFLDLHGREVHAFSMEMANAGFHRMADLLVSMLESGSWRSFKDGLGKYAFLPGEFDYFLSSRGISREDVMKIPDIEIKAKLDAVMDERLTGKGKRRPVLQARAENPQRPGQPIEPFGHTETEAKALVNGTAPAGRVKHQRPLGWRVRQFRDSEGQTTKAPSETLPLAERLRRQALRLGDGDLADLISSLKQEQRRRRRST